MTTGTYFFSGRDRYYDRKKKTVVCLAGAQSLLRPEKKDTVVCLAGARSLLRPEKKVPVVCLAGALSLLRPENKKVPVVCLAGRRSLLRPEKKVIEPKPFSRRNQKLTQHTAQLEKRFLQPTRSKCSCFSVCPSVRQSVCKG